MSLIPTAEPITMNIEEYMVPYIDGNINAINNTVITQSNIPTNGTNIILLDSIVEVFETIWIFGIVFFFVYTAISYWRLRCKVHTAVRYKDNIFQSENVISPFVLGIIKPKMYIPFKVEIMELEHIVAHEKAHIRRKDHWWKPLGFIVLMVHWFNPLMWLAYVLLCRDIELACDEKVIKELGNEQRADYTQSLVAYSVNRRIIAACPLAFGEVGVKERVKSVMDYKKPTLWVIISAMLVCTIVSVCFLTNPTKVPETTESDNSGNIGKEHITEPIFSFDNSVFKHENPTFKYSDVFYDQGNDNTIYYVNKWFDNLHNWEDSLTIELPEYPGVEFKYITDYRGSTITASKPFGTQDSTESVTLISGTTIDNAYFADLTGDGFPEICSSVSCGFGLIDERVIIYDYAKGVSYSLEERGSYDYSLKMDKNDGRLYVYKKHCNGGGLICSGKLVVQNNCIRILVEMPTES